MKRYLQVDLTFTTLGRGPKDLAQYGSRWDCFCDHQKAAQHVNSNVQQLPPGGLKVSGVGVALRCSVWFPLQDGDLTSRGRWVPNEFGYLCCSVFVVSWILLVLF